MNCTRSGGKARATGTGMVGIRDSAGSGTLGGVTIHVSHGHELKRPTPELVLGRYQGDVVVFGHTRRALIVRDVANRTAVNPGAAGPRRFDLQPSVARVTIRDGEADVEIISLA